MEDKQNPGEKTSPGSAKMEDKQNPGRKTSPGSAFHFFLMEQKENFRKLGITFVTQEELAATVHQDWKELLEKEPEKLEKYMKQQNDWNLNKHKSDLKNKFDQSGRSLEQILKEDEVKLEEKQKQARSIKTIVEHGKIKGIISEEKFLIAYFNTICTTLEGYHFPCELAIVEFSIEAGLGKSFQEFISPIKVPFGYRFECLKKSKETHNIPPDPNDFDLYVGDYKLIFESMKKFMTNGEPGAELPPLYVMPNHTEAAEFIVKAIADQAQSDNIIKIHKLSQLLYELRKAAPDMELKKEDNPREGGEKEEPLIPSAAVAAMLLDKETYSYWRGLGCDFHEELDNNCFCALTIAKGLAYRMAALCSKPFNINMRPEYHTPPEYQNEKTKVSGYISTVNKNKDIVKQAVTPEENNAWGTKVSIRAAPAGVTSIPNSFDPDTVEFGVGAQEFPGLHPDSIHQNQYSRSSLARPISQNMKSPANHIRGTLPALANRQGTVRDMKQGAGSHVAQEKRRPNSGTPEINKSQSKKMENSGMMKEMMPETSRAKLCRADVK